MVEQISRFFFGLLNVYLKVRIHFFAKQSQIILNLSAWAVLPFMDAIAKYLSAEMSFFQITWARYFFTVAFTLPIMFFFFRKNLVWTDKPKLQLIRGLILLTANVFK